MTNAQIRKLAARAASKVAAIRDLQPGRATSARFGKLVDEFNKLYDKLWDLGDVKMHEAGVDLSALWNAYEEADADYVHFSYYADVEEYEEQMKARSGKKKAAAKKKPKKNPRSVINSYLKGL